MSAIGKALQRLPLLHEGKVEVPFHGQPSSIDLRLPGELDPSRTIGDGQGTSIAQAIINWYINAFPEAQLEVTTPDDETGLRLPVEDHELVQLLENPNPHYGGDELFAGCIVSDIVDGNSYILKLRNGSGRLAELYWGSHAMIEPRGGRGVSAPLIEYYEYNVSGQRFKIPITEVVHLRHGMDPKNPRKGMSRLKGQLRELMTDEEAGRFTSALVVNMGVPGLVVSPKTGEDHDVDEPGANLIKAKLDQGTGGSNRGRSVVLSGAVDIKEYGFSPEQMDLSAVRGVPEERVSAALGVPAAVVGFGTGLSQTKVGAPQPLTARLWSPSGPVRMGDVGVGDLVATPRGFEPVEAIYAQGEQDVYRVTFQDGSETECTLDHLWEVKTPNEAVQTVPLSAIAASPDWKLRRTALPLQGVTEFNEQPVPIPPYLLGLLIADGTFRRNLQLAATAPEIVEHARDAVPAGYTMKRTTTDGIDYRIVYDDARKGRGPGGGTGAVNPMKDALRALGLWMKYSHEKFIPDVYKYNSSHVRLEILRGILDGDGFVNHHGQPALEQSSQQLAEDVRTVVQSLGGYTLDSRKRANRSERLIKGRPFRSRHDRIHQSIVIEDGARLFSYSEKRERCRLRTKAATRKFRSIEYVRRDQTQCIQLSGSLYLTDEFLTTHNTMRELREMAAEQGLVPLWRRFGKGLDRQLTYEYQTSNSRYRLAFNTDDVRVLQEDKQMKHERTRQDYQAAIIDGATAQGVLGYEVDESRRTYLQSGLLVERAVEEEPSDAKNWEMKLTPNQKDGLAFVRYTDRGMIPIERNYADALEKAFDGIGKAAAASFKANVSVADWSALDDDIREAKISKRDAQEAARYQRLVNATMKGVNSTKFSVEVITNGVYEQASELTIKGYKDAFDITLSIGERDLVAEEILKAGGKRVGLSDLSLQSRDAIFRSLAESKEAGLGMPQTARRIREHVAAGPYPHAGVAYRAETIARTEARWAMNRSTAEVGKAAGFKKYVAFDDRIGFGDAECVARDGEESDYAAMVGAEDHPRGTLSWSPVPRSGPSAGQLARAGG